MPKRNLTNRIKRWLRNTVKQVCNAIATFVRRSLSRRRRHPRRRTAGFLLPTTALLLLLMSLVVGALLIRTFNRTEQVVGAREQRVIYNATSPAIERGKAKLEYMFSNDPRVTTGVPSQEVLRSMMLNDGSNDIEPYEVDNGDPYTLPDETRIDINGGGDDNAWWFPVDLNGDGQINEGEDGKVAYSLIWQVPTTGNNEETGEGQINPILYRGDADELAEGDADGSYVRRGPIVASALSPGCPLDDDVAPPIENGWFSSETNTATLRKNFQIDAVLIPDDPNVTTQATLEVQQERQSNRGNKWGAWFRTDIEVYSGPAFRFNGAMHTEGSYFFTKLLGDGFQSFLISSTDSCLYTDPSASELTLNEVRSDANDDDSPLVFQGQAIHGTIVANQFVDGGAVTGADPADFGAPVHVHRGGDQPLATDDLNGVDSSESISLISIPGEANSDSVINSPLQPADLMLNPLAIVTENKSRAFSQDPDPAPDILTPYPTNVRDGNWANSIFNSSPARILNVSNQQPFIDDVYRADGRLGPKPTYGRNSEFKLSDMGPNGTLISGVGGEEEEALMKMEGNGSDDVGLDGYWERRAVNGGMRIVVGQRLELGDPLEPLDPFDSGSDNYPNHYERQRRTLRDNLAAVQATAIYHSAHDDSEDGGTPYAALISTVHPGTPDTLERSATFDRLSFEFAVKSDYTSLFGSEFGDDDSNFEELPINFFRGYGTNGWEFEIHNDFERGTNLQDPALRDALLNLAYFAGDPEGAFPPVQEEDAIHPIPELTEWGNFSSLRRALFDPQGTAEAQIADNSYIQTSAMLLGALAYNVSYLDAFDYENSTNKLLIYNPDNPDGDPNSLVEFLEVLNDGDVSNGEVAYFPDEDLNNDGDCSDTDLWNGQIEREAFGDRNPTMDDADGDDPDNRLCKQDGRYIPSVIVFSRDSTANQPDVLSRIPVDYAEGDLSTAMPEAYLLALEEWLEDEPDNSELRQAVDLERLLIDKEQVDRDRKFGFKATPKQPIPEDPAEDLGFYQYSIRFIPEDADLDGTFDVFDPTEDDEDAFATNRTEDLNGDNRVAFSEGIGLGDDADAWDDPEMAATTDDIIDNDVWDLNIEDINNNDALNTDLMVEEVDRDMDMEISAVGEDYNYNGDLQEGEEVEVDEDIFRNEELDINEGRFDGTKWVWSPAVDPGDPPPDPEDVNDVNVNGNMVWDTAFRVNLGCNYRTPDPDENIEGGSDYLSLGDPADEATWDAQREAERRFLLLASAVCPAHAKYPALYYLFPKDGHTDYQTVDVDLTGDGQVNDSDHQPLSVEEDLDGDGDLDFYEDLNRNGVVDDDPSDDAFDAIVYLSRNGEDRNDFLDDLSPGFRVIDESALADLTTGPKKIDDWGLPYNEEGTSPPSECDNDATSNDPNPNCSQYNLVALQNENLNAYRYYRVGFKDTAFFDGRELMNVRYMNVDLQMLTDKAGGENGTIEGSDWIVVGSLEGSNITGGIVYSAREDAVREDAIARPASTDWDAYQQSYQQNYGTPAQNLRMNADVPQDPPVSDPNQISPKPIDFYADPDRRPYGFRLTNGSDLSRGDTVVGMTWVTDNPVFIKGNFNCHGECTDQEEEFPETLREDYSNFYTRRGPRNENFAIPSGDSWRTTEIIADAGGIQSDWFCDGSIADPFVNAETTPNLNAILQDRYGCNAGARFTSYFNHGTVERFRDWVLENPARDWQATDASSVQERYENLDAPIAISVNGNPLCEDQECATTGTPTGNYWEYSKDDYFPLNASREGNQGRQVPWATDTFVNAALFSGIIPSRPGQPNGGLHNFPRFLEDWNNSGANLLFSGSLMQLSFSNMATAPFQLNRWEPDEIPVPTNSVALATGDSPGAPQFYLPPDRRWGYDVALQLVQAAPVAQRLLAVGNARSEFYSEPEADDPYIQQLRCTVDNSRPGC